MRRSGELLSTKSAVTRASGPTVRTPGISFRLWEGRGVVSLDCTTAWYPPAARRAPLSIWPSIMVDSSVTHERVKTTMANGAKVSPVRTGRPSGYMVPTRAGKACDRRARRRTTVARRCCWKLTRRMPAQDLHGWRDFAKERSVCDHLSRRS